LAAGGATLLLEALDRYAAGTLTRTPQAQVAADDGVDETEIAATRTRPLHKDDLRILWSDPRARVLDTVRAFAPQPLARVAVDDDLIKIAAARAADPAEVAPEAAPTAAGTFLIGGKRAFFGGVCGDGGLVALERVIAPGRGITDGATFARARFERRVRAGSAR
jgi:methionyl-tRNA formyltransferase